MNPSLLRLVPLVSMLLDAGCAATVTPTTRAPSHPNVLFIAIDDLNDWVGALGGHPQARTPNIDRLAARGQLFTNAHAAAPACNPSRTSLLTGWRPWRSGVYHNPQPWRPVMPDAVTLPRHFRENGYITLGTGKIFHHNYVDPPSWTSFHPSQERPRDDDPIPETLPAAGAAAAGHFDWAKLTVGDEAMADAHAVDWMVTQLSRRQPKPAFFACGIYRPHLPWYVPAAYFDAFPLDEIQLPAVLDTDLQDLPAAALAIAKPDGDHRRVTQAGQWAQAVQAYLASIAFADRQVGRLLDALDAGPNAHDTIVVLWSDHGWHLGEKQHWRKFALWERATRVPLVVVAPGVTRPGTRSARPVNLIDVYPTLVDLAGLPARNDQDGVSLRPLLLDPEAHWDRPSITTHGRGNHAVRDERWRYIRYADGGEELYDHAQDPHEWHNLADRPEHDAVKRALTAWLPKDEAENAPEEKAHAGAGHSSAARSAVGAVLLADALTGAAPPPGAASKRARGGRFTAQGWESTDDDGGLVLELSAAQGLQGTLEVDVSGLDLARPGEPGRNQKIHFLSMSSSATAEHHIEHGGGPDDALWTLRAGLDDGQPRYGNTFKLLWASRGAKRTPNSDYGEKRVELPDDWRWDPGRRYRFRISWSRPRGTLTVAINGRVLLSRPWAAQVTPLRFIHLGDGGEYGSLIGARFANLRVLAH